MKIIKSLLIAAVAVAGVSLASCDGKKAEEKATPEAKAEKATVATIIDFNATWCGPCKQFAPIFEAAAEKYQGVDFQSVDVDENGAMAEQYGVQSIPMVVLLDKDGNVLDTNVGFMEAADFDQLIEKYL
ncbi:MAG: thioredoxin family protein [Muribaculaceae bacterium]|nr:thioredoxin family protein [Muribaculaceae bacterium]MDE6345052.1 thioredoxin family protein [Muribaculaceae bacterium]